LELTVIAFFDINVECLRKVLGDNRAAKATGHRNICRRRKS